MTDTPQTAGSFPSLQQEQATAPDLEQEMVGLEWLHSGRQQRGRDETPRHASPPLPHQHGPCAGASRGLTPSPW